METGIVVPLLSFACALVAFIAILYTAYQAGAIRRNTVVISTQLDQAIRALGVKDPLADRQAAQQSTGR